MQNMASSSMWARRVGVLMTSFAVGCRTHDGISGNSPIDETPLGPSTAVVRGDDLRSLRADVSRTITFTEPNGVVRHEVVTYQVNRSRSPDGSWSTVIRIPRRPDLFDPPAGSLPTASRQPVEIEYSDPRSILVRFDDGTTTVWSGAQEFAGAAVDVVTGRALHNPVLDGSSPPNVDNPSGVTGIAPSIVRRTASSGVLQRLEHAFGKPVRLASEQLEFKRSIGSRTMRVVFDERAGGVIEQEIKEGGQSIGRMKRRLVEVAPDIFLPNDISLQFVLFRGKTKLDVFTVFSNVSITQ